MVSFIGAISMGIAAIVVATRSLGVLVKCINTLFDDINDGLEEKKRQRRERKQQRLLN